MTLAVTEVFRESHLSLADREPTPRASRENRVHYLDNLRAIAMLGGVFLHAAFAYAWPAQSLWLATDPGSSVLIDASIWWIHLFRMSLFFAISGYFAKLTFERKGVIRFLSSRLLRIAVPFAIFYPFLLGAMTAVIGFSITSLDSPQGLMGFIKEAIQRDSEPIKRSPLSTMHLWFLYYLMAFSILGVLFSQISWLRFDWLFSRPKLLLLFPLALIPGVLGAGVPLPSPESFVPTWWPFVFYGLFYWGGWQMYGREKSLERLLPYVWILFSLGLVLFVPYYWLMPNLNLKSIVGGLTRPNPWSYGLASLLTAYLSVLLTIVSLLLGARYLSARSPFLSVVADESYWVYLIHLPIVIFLQTLLIPLSWPIWLKLAVTLMGTLLPCFATYLVFVRYTPVGWLLHGKREFP